MPTLSAGILLYRFREGILEVLLAHPGGPFWKSKDQGAWSIPKGLAEPGEPLEDAARREFHEETGQSAAGPLIPLTPVKLKSGKLVHAFACEGDCDPLQCRSNSVRLEWPPRSGRFMTFPEVDGVAWFTLEEAGGRINDAQRPLLRQLADALRDDSK